MYPSDMTPEQRQAEIGYLLARGYLRLRAKSSADNSAVNREEDLDERLDKSVYAPAKTDEI